MKLAMHRLLHFMELVICIAFVIHICTEFPRTDCRFDYQGILVGIISALITLVVAWDIYQGIGFDRAKDEVLKIRETLDMKIDHCNNRINYFSALPYAFKMNSIAISFIDNNESIRKNEMILNGLIAIKQLSCISDCEKEIDSITSTLTEALNITKEVCISQKEKTEYILMCGEIQHRERVTGFNVLLSLIENLKTN